MKLIKPSFKIKEQDPGLDGIYKQVEWAGRHCYKSLDKITETSAKEFVDRMIKSDHGAMLEHGTVYLTIPDNEVFNFLGDNWVHNTYISSPYSIVTYEKGKYYVTTNLRMLVENECLEDLKYLCEPTEYHEKRVCVEFICDRGVSHEFVRHKLLCVA